MGCSDDGRCYGNSRYGGINDWVKDYVNPCMKFEDIVLTSFCIVT